MLTNDFGQQAFRSGGSKIVKMPVRISLRVRLDLRHNAVHGKPAAFYVDLEIKGLQGPIVNTTMHTKASAGRVAAYRSVLYKDLYFLRHTRCVDLEGAG